MPPQAPADQGERLSAILEVAAALVTEQSVASLLPWFASRLPGALHAAETGIVLMYDLSTERLAPVTALGLQTAPLKRIRLALGEAMSGTALATGQPGLYPTPDAVKTIDMGMGPRNQALFEEATAGLGQPLSALCVPPITAETKVSALVLGNRSRTQVFGQEDLPFLKALAELVALAIDNARLRKASGRAGAGRGEPAQSRADVNARPRDAHAHVDPGLLDGAADG